MSRAEWRAKYEQRIRSAQWKNMRADLIRMRGPRCERCGCGPPLELHHKTYERMGRELLSDLELLCRTCHDAADRQRETISAERSERRRFDAGLETFAIKKYGEDWRERLDEQSVWEEFEEWLSEQ